MNFCRLPLLLILAVSSPSAWADQFVLFDRTFTFTADEAVATQSHLFVKGPELPPECPKDWTSPVDYRNGSVHVRIEVLEKPEGGEPTNWSLCYIPIKGQGNGYGCTNTPMYTDVGVYEKTVKMTEFWENEGIVWSEGIKQMSLVLKGKGGGKSHAHLRPDLTKFFPTKVRVMMVQVSAGAEYDGSKVPLVIRE